MLIFLCKIFYMIHLITSFYIEKRKSDNVERKSENVERKSENDIEIHRLKNEINNLKGIPVNKKSKGHSTIERNAELQRCLMYNLKSIYISTIHLFVEDEGAAKKAMEIADDLDKELLDTSVNRSNTNTYPCVMGHQRHEFFLCNLFTKIRPKP